MAVFEDRPDCDGELFMTVVALEAALPMPGPFLAADTVKPRHVLHGAAMWADWTIRPQDAFDGFASLIFGKGGDLVEGQHGAFPSNFYLQDRDLATLCRENMTVFPGGC